MYWHNVDIAAAFIVVLTPVLLLFAALLYPNGFRQWVALRWHNVKVLAYDWQQGYPVHRCIQCRYLCNCVTRYRDQCKTCDGCWYEGKVT